MQHEPTVFKGAYQVDFNNTLFFIEKETILDCQHGNHYYNKKERKENMA